MKTKDYSIKVEQVITDIRMAIVEERKNHTNINSKDWLDRRKEIVEEQCYKNDMNLNHIKTIME